MPYTTVTPPITGTPISSSNFGIPMANNSAYFLNGKVIKDIFATYAATFALSTTASGAGTYIGFTQIDQASPSPGSMAMQSFVATSGRIQGVYYFIAQSDNTSHTSFQDWLTVGLLTGAYNGTFVTFDMTNGTTNITSTAAAQSTTAGNGTGLAAASARILPFTFNGLSAGTTYTVAPYWRNWSLTGNGNAVTTLYGASMVRGILWEN